VIESAYNDISDIKTWFFQQKLPFWKLYIGISENKRSLTPTAQNLVTGILEESWKRLEQTIVQQSKRGGRFTVFISEKKAGTQGLTAYLEVQQDVAIAGNNSTQFHGKNVDEYIVEKFNAMWELATLRQEKAALEQQIKDNSYDTIQEKLVGSMLESEGGIRGLIQEAYMGYAMITGKIPPQMTPGIAGNQKEGAKISYSDTEEEHIYDVEIVGECFEVIRKNTGMP